MRLRILINLLTTSSAIITIMCGFTQTRDTWLNNKKRVLKPKHVNTGMTMICIGESNTITKIASLFLFILNSLHLS